MKKKTSTFAIVMAIFFSIFLFPIILLCGCGAGIIFSVESVMEQGREEELYEAFVTHDGMDALYDIFMEEVEQQDGVELFLSGMEKEQFFPREQFAKMADDIYHAVLRGEEYTTDFSYQKNVLREYAIREFEDSLEENLEKELREQYEAVYEELSEEEKQQILKTAEEEVRIQFEDELERVLEATLSEAEQKVSEGIHAVYEQEEYQRLKEIEEEYQFSLTDRTELCYYLKLIGYVMLAITAFFTLALLLSHLFRPSGFFTAGAFSLIIAAGMYLISSGMNSVVHLIGIELKEENIAEQMQKLILALSETVIGWCREGFEYTGKIFAGAAVLLLLVGILLLVIRRNQAEAEAASGLER